MSPAAPPVPGSGPIQVGRVALLLGCAALLDAWLLVAGANQLTLGAHLVAVLLASRATRLGSHRALITALVFALPLGGALIAGVTLVARGRAAGEREPEQAAPPLLITAREVRLQADALAPADVIVSGDGDARREVLADLVARGDGESVALLHWALRRDDPELALEAALALEALEAGHAGRVVAGRAAFAELGTFDAALALADTLAATIRTGFTEGTLARSPAAEARRAYACATSLGGPRVALATEHLALLELAARRPQAALAAVELLSSSGAMRPELETLRGDTYLAARQTAAFARLREAT